MHLLRKSWWIYKLNFKSKAHSRSPPAWGRAATSRPPSLAPRPAITHRQGRHLEGGIASDCYPRRARNAGDEWERNPPRVYEHLIRNVSSFCAIVISLANFSSTKEFWKLPQSRIFHISFLLHTTAGYSSTFFLSTSYLNHLNLITYCSFYCCLPSLFPFLFEHFCARQCLVARLIIIRAGSVFNLFHSIINTQHK